MKKILSLLAISVLCACTGGSMADETESNFNNPFGYFTIIKKNGTYEVIPEMKIDQAIFEQYIHNGGWIQSNPYGFTENGVIDEALISGSDVLWLFEQNNKLTSIHYIGPAGGFDKYDYSICENILSFAGQKYIICHIDQKKLILVSTGYTDKKFCGMIHFYNNAAEDVVQQWKEGVSL